MFVSIQPLLAVVAGEVEEDERPFYVLSGLHLNKWILGDYNAEKVLLLYIHKDVYRPWEHL